MTAPTVIERLRAQAAVYRKMAHQNESTNGRQLDNDTANALDRQANELELRDAPAVAHDLELAENAEFFAVCHLEAAITTATRRGSITRALDEMEEMMRHFA